MKLQTTKDGRLKCYCCEKRMPEGMEYVGFSINVYRSDINRRICGICLLRLTSEIDMKKINKFKLLGVIDKL